MRLNRWLTPLVIGAFVLGVYASAQSPLPTAAGIESEMVSGNPTCEDVGYECGFKLDPPSAGTYDVGGGTITLVFPSDPYGDPYFDWSSTIVIEAVLAKGGPVANLYEYPPDGVITADQGLSAPDRVPGRPYGLSHVEFCCVGEER